MQSVAAPGGDREQTECERRDDREKAVDEHRRDDGRVRATEADERPGEPQLDHTKPAGRERDDREQARERPGGECLDHRHVGGRDAERAQAKDEDEEDRQLACERGERQRVPAAAEQSVGNVKLANWFQIPVSVTALPTSPL